MTEHPDIDILRKLAAPLEEKIPGITNYLLEPKETSAGLHLILELCRLRIMYMTLKDRAFLNDSGQIQILADCIAKAIYSNNGGLTNEHWEESVRSILPSNLAEALIDLSKSGAGDKKDGLEFVHGILARAHSLHHALPESSPLEWVGRIVEQRTRGLNELLARPVIQPINKDQARISNVCELARADIDGVNKFSEIQRTKVAICLLLEQNMNRSFKSIDITRAMDEAEIKKPANLRSVMLSEEMGRAVEGDRKEGSGCYTYKVQNVVILTRWLGNLSRGAAAVGV